jgi:aldose 1-epimerase
MSASRHWCFPGKLSQTLRSVSARSQADVLIDCGFNCARWFTRLSGQALEILWPGGLCETSASLAPGAEPLSPFRFGIPVLFPFPNRIRGGVYHWSGREYRLPINDPQQRHAIHGFVADRPWTLLRTTEQGSPAQVTGQFRLSQHAPERLSLWPADFTVTLTWQLRERNQPSPSVELSAEVTVYNPDIVPLPFGLGFHPYFAVPADDAQVLVESARHAAAELRRWELTDLIPTGRLLPLRVQDRQLLDPCTTEPLPAWDDAFRFLPATENAPLVVLLRDRRRHFAIRIQTEPHFRDLVLFVPPHRQAVCIEPYTCVTDAINLHQRGVASGLRILQPGQEWRTSLTITVFPEP